MIAAAIIQHNIIVITELYSIVDPDLSSGWQFRSDWLRGLSTNTGYLTTFGTAV